MKEKDVVMTEIPLNIDHLIGWWDGQTALLFCKARKALVEVDIVTVRALLGVESTSEVINENITLLLNTKLSLDVKPKPLPSGSFIVPLNEEIQKSPERYIIVTDCLTIYFEIRSEWILERVVALFSSLSDDSKVSVQSNVLIKVLASERGFDVFANGLYTWSAARKEDVIPLLMDFVMTAYYRAAELTYAFHGAALQYKGVNYLIVAPSGRGKSTLTSYLYQQGAAIYSDELIGLKENFELLPVRLPITLKQGSWGLFSGLKEVEPKTVYGRGDERQIKYFDLGGQSYEDNLPLKVVFPEYSPEKDANVQQIGAVTAMKLFGESGYELLNGVNEDDVKKLVSKLDSVEVFHITYSHCSQFDQLLGI